MRYMIESDSEVKVVPITEPERPTGKIFTNGHFTWEEVLNTKDKFWKEFRQYIYNIILLCCMLEEYRFIIKRAISIESWFRSIWYNDVDLPNRGYKSSKTSDHKEGRAADTDVPATDYNIKVWKEVCERHNVYWSIGKYKWGLHVGFRFDKNKYWDYR